MLSLADGAEGFSGVHFGASQDTHEDYNLAAALEGWHGGISTPKSRRVAFEFDDGRPVHTERLFDLIVATDELDGQEVHLTDGSWFHVRAGLLQIVDDELDALPEWDVALPAWSWGARRSSNAR